jgi:glycosyltransferase involved in cell wall biosynthesis
VRVVVINDFAHINGGASAVAVASAGGLARHGHHVTFFSAVGPADPGLERSGVEVICTGQRKIIAEPNRLRAIGQGLWNTVASRALRRCLEPMSRDDTIIHLHSWTKALSSSVLRTGFDLGYKVVCTLHDYNVACPNGALFDFRSLSPCHLRPMSLSCIACNCDPRRFSHKLWRVTRQAVQEGIGGLPGRIDAFVTVSGFSREILQPYLPDRAHVFEVPNPISAHLEPPVDVGANREFAMVAWMSSEKGVALFARAARDCGAPALFVGDGPARNHISSLYPEAVITGWVPQAELGGYLARARALVFPSLCYETQGLVVLEAAARGIPAVVSEDCAAREIVVDGVTGLLFKGGSVPDLSAALDRLRDDAFVRHLGRAAYERFWENPPTVERHVEGLELVYKTVLGAQS